MRTIAAAISILVLANLARADFIQVQAEGTFDVVEINQDQMSIIFDAAVFDQIGGFGITTVNGEATQVFTVDPLTDDFFGSGQLVGATPDDFLTYTFDSVMFPGDVTATFAGTWEVTGGFGDFEGLIGSGQLSGFYRFKDANSGQFGIVFQGDLVPAPPTLVLLGGASLALMRRRR